MPPPASRSRSKPDPGTPSTLAVSRWPHEVPRPIVATGVNTTLARSAETAVHHHRKAQLVMTRSGVVTCEVDRNVWIVPPRCAVWIPGGVPHSLRMSGEVALCCLFVEPDALPGLPRECCTVSVSPLLRELLLQAVTFSGSYDENGSEGRLARVLLDQLAAAPVERLNVPMPVEPRLRRIADALIADPSDRATVAEWGRRVGAAERTLARILRREVGMSFGRWRQQLHLLVALQRLAAGSSVQAVALDLGYESASPFITMFRKTLGRSPGRYLAEHVA